MWTIKPQQVRKSLVLVKAIKRFPKFDSNGNFEGSGPMTDPASWSVRCLISNQRKNELVFKLGHNPAKGTWTLQHPDREDFAPLALDGGQMKLTDEEKEFQARGGYVKPKFHRRTVQNRRKQTILNTLPNAETGEVRKVMRPGEKEVYDTRREFFDRISRFTGPDFAAQVIAVLTLAAKELLNEEG